MTKTEAAGLAALTTAIAALAEAQAKQTAQMSEVLDLLRNKQAPPAQHRDPDTAAVESAQVRLIQHDADEPVTLVWNGQRLTVHPGPNTVPAPFAAQYENWKRDVAFQKANARRLQDPGYLSRQLARMASEAGLEMESDESP